MFQAPPTPTPLPSAGIPGRKPAAEGEFTKMMRTPSAAPDNLFAPAPPSQGDLYGERRGGVEQDEFSRIATGGNSPQQPPPKANTDASPAATPKSSNLPIILIVGGLLVVALVLIVIFAVMR